MRKYIIGGLVGFCLSFGFGAHAEVVNMIGKAIDGAFPVKLDGKELDNQAIVVEGTSYLPVRAIGEAIGYKVGFDADLGISLTKSVTDVTYEDNPVEPQPKATIKELTPEQKARKIKGIGDLIETTNMDLERNKQWLDYYKQSQPDNVDRLKFLQETIDKQQAEITDLEKQKAELSK